MRDAIKRDESVEMYGWSLISSFEVFVSLLESSPYLEQLTFVIIEALRLSTKM